MHFPNAQTTTSVEDRHAIVIFAIMATRWPSVDVNELAELYRRAAVHRESPPGAQGSVKGSYAIAIDVRDGAPFKLHVDPHYAYGFHLVVGRDAGELLARWNLIDPPAAVVNVHSADVLRDYQGQRGEPPHETLRRAGADVTWSRFA